MMVRRADDGIMAGPFGIANGPFFLQPILTSSVDGELTAVRTWFDPGVTSHWHSHPRGQLLFVLDGVGCAQVDGDAVIELRTGDSIWFAPDQRHWHGASPRSSFSYISIQPNGADGAVRWMEPVAVA